jgi:excisionase family DNA binding protein
MSEQGRTATMSSRLGGTFDQDDSGQLPDLVGSEPGRSESVGLADSLEQKRRALLVVEVAQLLNISERQVYKLVAEHRIPCFKIGASIRFDPVAISAWLRGKMAPAAGESVSRRKG